MKHLSLFLLLLIFTTTMFAQRANKAYAFTGQVAGNFNWTDIREIDLSTGAASSTFFENGKTNFSFADASGKKRTPVVVASVANAEPNADAPTYSMVAAAAFDKVHNKLFFTPMKVGELRWLDLSSKNSTLKFYSLQSKLFGAGDLENEANHLTRMVIAGDGKGYAITNDGSHVYRFTTGNHPEITDLGKLVDASSNSGVSIANKCTSWGGDMVSDVNGKLYLFTAAQHVFKIDLNTLVATYAGHIKDLSPTFSVNGAAVDNDDNVIISSANTFEGFYKVNVKDLSTSKLNTTGQVFNASDLANGNLLFENSKAGVAKLPSTDVIENDHIALYPNPVISSQFKVTFNGQKPGKYTVSLSDLQGRLIKHEQVNLKSLNQTENISLSKKPSNGMYLIKVLDANNQAVFSNKVVVE
ncbi:MAG: T9SS type A sorting domain-containing protein [Ginsengibacter sp.]